MQGNNTNLNSYFFVLVFTFRFLSVIIHFVNGGVAQLGERTVQFCVPKFGDVAQASGGWFASMPPKKSIRACSSAGRAFGSHPRGREFESLQVHQNVRNFLIFTEDSELFCIFQKQALSTVVILHRLFCASSSCASSAISSLHFATRLFSKSTLRRLLPRMTLIVSAS